MTIYCGMFVSTIIILINHKVFTLVLGVIMFRGVPCFNFFPLNFNLHLEERIKNLCIEKAHVLHNTILIICRPLDVEQSLAHFLVV
jgi:hypothetical protein